MMETALDIVSWVLLVTGSVFSMIGGLGLIRLPDVYTRMHGAGITDTMGAGLILAGLMVQGGFSQVTVKLIRLMVQGGFSQVTVKLILILIFLLYTSPTSTYALANAAFHRGQKPQLGNKDDPPSKP